MRVFNNQNIDRASIHVGHLNLTTVSCGCCSEWYTTDPEAYTGSFTVAQDELVKYIEREEERLERLKDYIADGGTLEKEDDA